MKKNIRKSVYVGVLLLVFSGIISCEKDFTDIGTSIIKNTVFSTKQELIDIKIEKSPVESVRSDNISTEPGQYLLGVHTTDDYEKIEASIISQVGISSGLTLGVDTYEADTTVVSTIDTVFIKLPYQATLQSNTSSGPTYTLDSIIGNKAKAFTLNVYESDKYLNTLDPTDPAKSNSYQSNEAYQKKGNELNDKLNYQFLPNEKDTVIIIKRWLSNLNLYTRDTVKYSISTSSTIPVPFARIPLNEAKFKTLFLDKYGSPEFESQQTFNNYFRGIILEATGSDGSLISFNFNTTIPGLNPSIEVYYTNTILKGTTIIDTIKKNDSFLLTGVRRNHFNMGEAPSAVNGQVIVQGAAGSEATITLFGDDLNGDGIADKLEELRTKEWLVNDASLTFYINQNADTTAIPKRMYLYKNQDGIVGQIRDSYSEANLFGGFLERVNGKATSYTFRITDYISRLINEETDYNPTLNLKIFNQSDLPVSDTIFRQYNWNPKAVTILTNSAIDENKKPQLKISYSKKNN